MAAGPGPAAPSRFPPLMVRRLAITAAAGALVVPAFAFAASFALSDGTIAAGSTAVTPCDVGFTVSYTTSGGNVTAVTVEDVADPECEGGELSVTLTDAGGTGIAGGGPVTIPTDGDASPNSVVVPVSPNPAAESVAGVAVAIAGP